MSANQRLTGPDLVVQFVPSGGGTLTLSGDQTSFEYTFDTNEADMTAGSDAYQYMKPTIKFNSATMSTLYRGTYDNTTWGSLAVGTEGQLYFYPEGETSNKPKGGFPAYVKTKSAPIPHNERIERRVTFQGQGGTYGTDVFDIDVHKVS